MCIRDRLKAWLMERGVETDSLSKASVQELLSQAYGEVELALSLRQELALSLIHIYPVYGGNGVNGYTSNYNVENETMVIGRVGEKCGNVKITQSRGWVSDNALIVTPKVKYDIEYMRYLLEQINLNDYANRNAQPVISGQIIYALETPYVGDVDEQGLIAQNLRCFDTYIDCLLYTSRCV